MALLAEYRRSSFSATPMVTKTVVLERSVPSVELGRSFPAVSVEQDLGERRFAITAYAKSPLSEFDVNHIDWKKVDRVVHEELDGDSLLSFDEYAPGLNEPGVTRNSSSDPKLHGRVGFGTPGSLFRGYVPGQLTSVVDALATESESLTLAVLGGLEAPRWRVSGRTKYGLLEVDFARRPLLQIVRTSVTKQADDLHNNVPLSEMSIRPGEEVDLSSTKPSESRFSFRFEILSATSDTTSSQGSSGTEIAVTEQEMFNYRGHFRRTLRLQRTLTDMEVPLIVKRIPNGTKVADFGTPSQHPLIWSDGKIIVDQGSVDAASREQEQLAVRLQAMGDGRGPPIWQIVLWSSIVTGLIIILVNVVARNRRAGRDGT